MPEASLFPNETILERHLGSIFIYPEQLGIPYTGLHERARHPVGGTLSVTQFRLLFEAMPFNQFSGTTTILLDTITSVEDTSTFLHPQLTIIAGIPYDIFLFQITPLHLTLNRLLARLDPQLVADGRDAAIQALLPPAATTSTALASVRTLLDRSTVAPMTALYLLSLHNLWLSLSKE
jgi:hypothetical protein